MATIHIGKYQASIYPEGKGYTGALSLGFDAQRKRQRVKRKGRTKAEVKAKLIEAVDELDAGITTEQDYTVEDCINDWLEKGLKGRDQGTIANYRSMAIHHIIPQIGKIKIKKLTADELDDWLDGRAEILATRSLRLIHQIIQRAIRHAQRRDKVKRNVADLVDIPEGQEGRPSKALNLEQAKTVIHAALSSPIMAYVIICLLCGIRTEEARALLWTEVDLKERTVAVYRAVRVKGETKTKKSRRVLKVSKLGIQVLKELHKARAAERLASGERGVDNTHVFRREDGRPLDRWYVRREFQKITKAAGIGDDWCPRELRHSFVSLLSAHKVAIEEIARLVGHSSTHVTETVYRQEIRPALTDGAVVMDKIFKPRAG
ncbi:tyrosine-type recombinase/integrase [Nonomuraea diastatica]|uniref:Site-specific integrase n=1 Tax=Nonomuraea diastatica TaxID=1848329 RepID=A0A4R4WX03_9ACTN|nr:tyrosine-type recombinase/integrase [Nonomuraea diastatica]TDD22251.1 site-specific integrase [Nonomuraea diastatica]